ncbi:mucin-5AC-like [Ictidomys tridecemlineatus]
MAVGRRKLAPLWALAFALACTRHPGQAQQGSLQPGREPSADLSPLPGHSGDPLLRMTDTPPLSTIPVVQAPNPAHNGRVCSTWGDSHYKTFDGDIFRFPGLCNYVFSAHCGAAYEDFNVQLRRSRAANTTTLSRVIMKLDGLVIELNESSVLVNGHPVQLPFSQSGVLMERSNGNLKVTARLGLVFMWDQDDDSLLLELDSKFANQTCGLCGDFNGIPVFNEFLSHDVRLTPMEFGNLQKMDGPTEQCQDPDPAPQNCSISSGICEELLRGQLFSGCAALVDVSSYVEACRQDLCLCEQADLPSCICHTLAEYSRQCAHAGGLPQDWRGPDLCYQTCPLNMQHQECGSPCTDTCSNPQRSQLCEDHCVAGCFCPEGTVFDDIGQTGCVPMSQCSCMYNGTSYAPGANYSTDCTRCTCSGGRWSCQEVPCQGTCSVLGGSHLSTFDEKQYTVHGDCSYVLTKPCHDDAFTVLAELRRCGLTESETCLKGVELRLGGGPTAVVVKASGEVFVNQIYTQLPVSTANVTLFRPSTFFIIAQTHLGVQLAIQLVPTMQVFVRLAPELRGLTCGLCGNFNSIQADDFRTNSGVVEGTGAAFANTWKTQAACPNAKSSFEDPCSLSVENEKYAQHWCSQLTSPDGPFAQCHTTVSPSTYYSNCMFDTCNCEKSEDCMCAALSSYVQACAAKGVLLRGWRAGVCTKPTTTCPKSMTYHYHISTCQPTCRALSEEDVTCHVSFVPVDGCACPEGMFLDASDKCVPAASCPCYHRGSMVPNGESLHDSGAVCTCTQGTLTCIGGPAPTQVCDAPMVYFDCHNATHGATGAGCQKSCHTLDMACYSPQCEPGCVCPPGLVADGSGGCIAAEDCPCMHNGASYRPGETIWAGCNTCTCENRMWRCTEEPCQATCALYGDGHFLTFDGQRYTFSGDCQYTLVQDHCGGNGSAKDAFRVVTENVPCGTTGTTCSKDIKIFLGSYELKLSSGKVEVVQKGAGQEPPYTIRQMGIYLVVDTDAGLVLLWDRRTSIFLRLSPEFKGRVCGLCGNFDGNALNDFTTRSQAVVGDALEFGNSWKLSPSCPDAPVPKDPCTTNPYRKAWAQKQCSIIHSATFATCHAHVEPTMYYEACVGDACACDSGGDCECFCTAVAAYAQACHEAGVCVSWRTPDVCPLFCDYYNPQGECEWHFQPCGAPCMRTCRNPSGRCLHDLRGLEGCYPKCPPSAPIFDEDKMQCVDKCPTPTPPPPCRIHGKSYRPGATVPSDKNCYSCICTENGVHCAYDSGACVCTYDGRHFHPGDVIYNTTDGMGSCISAHCGANGTVERRVFTCSPTTPRPPTTFSFSTSPHTTGTPLRTTPATPPVSSSVHCGEKCLWSPWLDVSRPGQGVDSGDFDTLQNLRAHGFRICQVPRAVQCRAEDAPEVPLQALGQRLECSPTAGLTCHNRDQASGLCHNYQIRVLCCSPLPCPTSSPPARHRTTNTVPTTSATVSSTPVRTSFLKSTPTPKTTSGTPSASASPPGRSQVTSVPTTSGVSPVSCLRESCTWTQWMDGSYPGPGKDSGDFDTFHNLRSKGYKFCERPTSVECRAQFFPNTPLAELGQQVTCNSEEGLICWNRDQLPPICYNYEIRIQCCELVDDCRNETIGTPKSIATHPKSTEGSTTTKTTVTTGSQATSTGHTTHPTPVHTSRGTSVGTKVTQSQTTDCQPQCTWTKWFDVDFPDPGPHGGDTETYSNILSKGERICLQPEDITRLECRAENHPEVSIEALGQVVQCEPHLGLVCRNQEQQGPLGMCLNYEVRVLCCHTPDGCPTTGPVTHSSTSRETVTSQVQKTDSALTVSPSSTRETSSTPVHTVSTSSTGKTSSTPVHTVSTSSTRETSSTPVHTVSTSSTGKTSSTPVPTSSSSHTPAPESTHSIPQTTNCQPQCTWTKWFDVDFPDPGPHGGDTETYSNILSKGERICLQPEDITRLECRAENHPEVSIEALGQVVQCEPHLGLVCRNQEQQGPLGMCLNYEVRVLCCHTPDGCPTTGPVTHSSTSRETVTSQVQKTDSALTVSPSSTRETSSTPVHTVSTSSTGKTSSTPVHTVSPSSTGKTSSTPVHTVSTSSTGKTSSTPVHTVSTSSTRETSSTPVHTVSTSSTGKTSSTPVPTSSSSHTPAPESTHSIPQTTNCQPQCTWTKWFDVDFPDPGPHGGDTETYSNILSKGERICLQPEDITRLECRAENHPEVSIEALGQVVQCEPHLGLVCRNQEQQGPLGMCLNYEVRVLCCHTPDGCPTTGPVTHSSTSRETVTSQVQKTDSALTVSPSSTQKTSSTSVHTVSTSSTWETSSTPVHTVSTSSTRETSSTYVHTVSPSSTWETSSTPVHTVSTSSTRETSSTPVHTVSTSSTRETSSTPVHTVSTSSTRETSSTPVHTVSTSSTGKTSSTPVHTVSTSSTGKTSSTPVHTVSTSSTRETSSTPVHTVSPSSTGKTSSTPVHTVSPSSTGKTSSTPVHTVSTSSTGKTSSTPVHTVSTSSTRETSSTPVHTVSTSSTQKTSSTPVHTVSPSSTQETSSTPVHTVSPSSTQETSSTPVHTVSTSSTRETSSTPVHTVSTSSTRETSSTPVHTVSTSSTGKTSSTPVHTVSTSSTRETSSTPVHTVSTSSTRETSSTPVHTVSPSSTQKTSSTPVHTVSPSSTRETSSTSVHTVSTSSTRETSSTPVHTVSTSPTRETSSTPVHTVSTSPTRETSSSPVHTVSPGSRGKTSSTPVHTVSPSSTGKTSSTPVHTISTSSTRETSSTPVHTVSTSSTRETSSTPVHTISTSSTRETSSTPVHTVSTSSTRETSSTPVHTVSTSSTQKTSSTPVHTVSTSSTRETSSTPVHTVSTSSTGKTSSTSVHTVSTSSTRETSSTPVHTVSTSSTGKTSSTPVHTVSPSSTRETSSTPVHTVSPSSTRETSSTPVHTVSTSSTGKTSSTPVPTSSSSHTPAPESTHSIPQTTNCQPQCTWTKWFDVDFPDPGPHGGDTETYSNILSKGERICLQPEDITRLECRAENHPEVSIEALGQVVQCEPHLGLVCRNQEQQGPLGMCLNYEVRVLCCHTPDGCPTTGPVTHSSTSRETMTSQVQKTDSALTVSPSSTRETSSTYVHTVSTSSTWETSSTPVHTVSPSSTQKTSSTPVHTVSTSSTGKTSSTPVHTVSTSSTGKTSSTPVHTVSTSSTRETSSTPVHTVSTSSTRETSSTPVHTVSPSSTRETSSTPVHTVSTSSTGKTSSTPVHTVSTSSTGKTSSTPVHTVSTSSTRETSSAPVHTVSPSSTGKTSSTPVHTVSTSSTGKTGSTPVHTVSTSSTGKTGSTPVHTVSTSSTGKTSSTPVHTVSTSSTGKTSSTPVHTVSTSSTGKTSSTPVHTVSTSSTGKTSSTPVHTVSTSSTRETSSTPVHTVSTSSTGKTSSTPVPTSSSSHTPAPESTHSTPQTTNCQPQCTWTRWFDVDFPDPGPHGGDTETYSNILSKGERICLQPEDITRLECRAENHPEVSIEALGQVVQCEPHLGLVCRNQEQQGPLGMCLNYEVRVLCCHTPDGCPTTGTPAWTAPPEPSSSVPSTSAVSSPWSPSSAASSTLPCFCSVLDQLYPAGSIIYRQRDLSGHCYYALCSQDCEVIKGVDHDCPSTTPPPTSASSLSMSTPETGCPNMHPPREKGETWPMPNCTQATCEGNSIISLRPRQCPEVKEPTCANGYPALRVADQDGCCQHYQCQCVCSGWGDPHYITFDGTYYTFLDNCTYVLVQQVVPVFGHFRVLINNDFCDPKDQLSCPQAIIVEYHQDRVVLTRTPVGGVMTNQIIFNNKVVSPGFQSNGIAVSRVGIKMYVTIREIGVQVMFSGLIFSVEVPFSTFANNTEGQCGTCTNDKRDECRLPGGTVAPSCSAMSGHWKVDVPGQPHCHGPPPTPPSTTPQTTPVQCPPSPLCELILSKVFQPCHHVISPQSFYEGCVFDYCHMTPPDVVCSGLQLYAALCASEGVCIDWRGHTDQACPFPCSAGKVYLPCGPSSLPYCYGKDSTSSLALPEAGPITEGCFCPENTMIFSSDAQVCVPANCSWCLGPHGEPVEPGHTISTDCQECTCQDSSQNLTCHRKPCPLPPACPLPGLVPVPTAPKAGQCCPQFVCACNTSYCPEPQHCPKGSRLFLTHEEGACCPSQICRGIGCNVNGTVYQPGAVVSSSLCERCWCEAAGSPPSGSFLVSCETQICNTHCPLGFEYQAQSGQCCGKCVAVSCVVNTSRGRDHFLHPGESWSDPENRCVTYRCEKHQDRLEVVTVEKQCAALGCARDQARLSSDGCCFVCPHVETSCTLHHRNQTIRQGSCSSATPVRLSYCQGNCGNSTSMYSLDTYTVERKCQCCQELRTSRKKVSLTCADGSSRTFSYTQAEACGCLGQQCHSPGDTSHSGSSESESKKSKEQSQESESSSWEGLPRPPQ